MDADTRRRWLRGAGKTGLAGLLLLLWLGVTMLASSPALHAVLHADAGAPDHRCIITLVSQGQLLAVGFAVLSLMAVVTGPIRLAGLVSVVLPAMPHRLAPSRAPPAAVSSQVLAG